MDLLERAALLDELSGALADTAAGGRLVLVAGEAGIGKSTLVRRFTERQAAQARFLLGACDPLLTPRALGPLHDIARQTGGRLAELLAAGAAREAVFAALLDQLAQPPRQVVVVEDAHWADEATLDLLVFLDGGWSGPRRCWSSPTGTTSSAPTTRSAGSWAPCPRGWCGACGRSRCPRRPWPSWPGAPAARPPGCAS
jgi:AAA ATPase domain